MAGRGSGAGGSAPKKKSIFRGIEPFKHKVEIHPDYAAKTWKKLEDAIRAELKRTEQVNALIRRVADGCFLLMVLHTRNISRLAARLEEGARRAIRSLRFREWMSHEEGDQAATMLIAALISEDLYEAGELSNELAITLQRGCPSYFKNDDRKYYEARSLLRRAEGAN